MCSDSPAAVCCLKAKECSEFKLTCQCEAYDAKSHELLRRCADLKWCKWLVRSSVIIITSYQIKKLEVCWQTDRWILTVKCRLMVMWSGRSLDKCGCNNFDWHYVSCVIFYFTCHLNSTFYLLSNPVCIERQNKLLKVPGNGGHVVFIDHLHTAANFLRYYTQGWKLKCTAVFQVASPMNLRNLTKCCHFITS